MRKDDKIFYMDKKYDFLENNSMDQDEYITNHHEMCKVRTADSIALVTNLLFFCTIFIIFLILLFSCLSKKFGRLLGFYDDKVKIKKIVSVYVDSKKIDSENVLIDCESFDSENVLIDCKKLDMGEVD